MAVYHLPDQRIGCEVECGGARFSAFGRVSVPKGQFVALRGMLLPSPVQPLLLYMLHTHDGAHWFLHTSKHVDHLLGGDVHIEGTCFDFATIDVERIWAVGEPRPVFWWERLAGMIDRGRP